MSTSHKVRACLYGQINAVSLHNCQLTETVGVKEGDSVGSSDGLAVGLDIGLLVGNADGITLMLGIAEGWTVGKIR